MDNSEKSESGNDSARPWESYNTVYTTAKAGLALKNQDSCQFFILDWCRFHQLVLNWKFDIYTLGMEGVDKEKVQRIVYEMSKGSKYFENEEKKEADMKRKVESMRMQLAKLTPHDVSNYQKVD